MFRVLAASARLTVVHPTLLSTNRLFLRHIPSRYFTQTRITSPTLFLARRSFHATPWRTQPHSNPTPGALPKEKSDRVPFRQKLLGQRTRFFLKYTFYIFGSTVVGIVVILSAIFIYDMFTYTKRHIEGVPVSPLALKPLRGGPKNLPIAKVLLSDIEDEEQAEISKRPRLVIIGGGWGALGIISTLHPGDYHVTVVAEQTYTTFTPLLPSAAVGTVQVRSLVEPLRKLVARLRGHVVNARAVDLVMSERLVEVELANPTGHKEHIYIPYDRLIIAVGSTSATHGVPGLEHCFQLKTIGDAQRIRQRILDNFETACLPTTSPEERRRLLSFVVCGGGPTGVETAAEIYDFCQEDVMNYYPKVCRADVSIHVIQSREHILNTYSEAIQRYAEEKFMHDGIDLATRARVTAVYPDKVVYTARGADGKIETYEIPTNFVLWSTGIAKNPFVERVCNLLPNQMHKRAIEVDAQLRVKGAPVGEVYAIGDASTIETDIVSYLLELVDESDKNRDGKIDYREWEIMVQGIKKRIPMSEKHLQQVREIFDLYDRDSDDKLNLNELAVLLREIGNKITALPATAQVASQEGKYLGRKLNKLAEHRETLLANQLTTTGPGIDEIVSGPFKYLHLGSLAYIGTAAVFDLGSMSWAGGLLAMYVWRSVYWSEQVSPRTRALLALDWAVRGIWGRDLSRL